ncbi:hypothetical protein BDV93DRAFT_608900 [Ceratobasidium sp. AG-I]|nr:hypothetical protein BDV93DRAFT_608900 [Ceratobasidium sp. AG-I]
MKIAADCGLFPPQHTIIYGTHFPGLPRSLPPAVGGFSLESNDMGWEPLGRGRHVLDADLDLSYLSAMEWCESVGSDGDEWLTYAVLRTLDPRLNISLGPLFKFDRSGHLDHVQRVNRAHKFNWADLFTEAQEISQHPNVKLDDIRFGWERRCYISLNRPEYGSWDEIPATLYYHWSPTLFDSRERQGFLSAEKTPDCGAWQKRLESQGWKFDFLLPYIYFHSCLIRSLPPAVGEFSLQSSPGDWESLGRSRYVLDADVNLGRSSAMEWCKSVWSDGDEWLTLISRGPLSELLADDCDRHYIYTEFIKQPFRFDWTDLFTEAQETSRRLNVKLDDIHFVRRSFIIITLTRPEYGSWDEIPTTLYYHWSPRSFDERERRGFHSTEKTPDCGAWQKRLETQGWKFVFWL